MRTPSPAIKIIHDRTRSPEIEYDVFSIRNEFSLKFHNKDNETYICITKDFLRILVVINTILSKYLLKTY